MRTYNILCMFIYIGIRFVNRLSTRFRCLRKILSIDPATNDPVCGPVSITMTVSPSDGVVITQPKAFTYNISGLADIVYTIRWTGVHDGHLYRLFASIGKFPGKFCCTGIIIVCTNSIRICIYCPAMVFNTVNITLKSLCILV